MKEYEREIDLSGLFDAFGRRWHWLVAGAAIGGILAAVASLAVPRQYQARALVLVSPGIEATPHTEEGVDGLLVSGGEVVLPGLAAQTYSALATGDELLVALRDSLKGLALPEAATQAAQDLDVVDMRQGQLEAYLMPETARAESPLLVLQARSREPDLPVVTVNLWAQMLIARHRGLSARVADEYYQWVQGQLDAVRGKLESTELELATMASTESELGEVLAEAESWRARLGTALAKHHELTSEWEAAKREYAFVRSRLAEVSVDGMWLGDVEPQRLETARQRRRLTPAGAQIVKDLVSLEEALGDSARVGQTQEAMRRDLASEQEMERVRRRLSLSRQAVDGHRREYAALAARQIELERQVAELEALARFEKANVETWREQARNRRQRVTELEVARRRLERSSTLYEGAAARLARRAEETRRAREQAAGDIQLVSKAAVPVPTDRGLGVYGLAGSLLGLVLAAGAALVAGKGAEDEA